tara:strand:- start:5691 stop:6518 length:828 start_codon:yes stop_codon:yes gene_type:complete
MAIDHVLKLYSETIRSSYLHYGFWDKPSSVDLDAITLADLKRAQERYIVHLASFIPENVLSILDVGCGIGGNASYLLNKGFQVETLSPDQYQKMIIKEKFNGDMVFHHCKFESFTPTKTYDLILQSESTCYIKIDLGFEKAKQALPDGGYLLASDYFVHYRDGSKNPHLKSAHDLETYLQAAEEYGFEIVKEYDQTENTMPTLDYGRYFFERFIQPTFTYGLYSAKKNYPKTLSMVQKLVEPKLKKKMTQLELINSDQFRKFRKYMIFLFQKKNA